MKDKFFLACIFCAAFFINCEYGITRPASNGLLLTYFSSQMIPWIWLFAVPLNLLIVSLYNRYLAKRGPIQMLGLVAAVTVVINGLTGAFAASFPPIILLQFAWKDIYILLMFKQLWSLIHSSPLASRAKLIYGVIYAVGTLGAVVGSLVPGLFAVYIGSKQLFFLTLPLYVILFLSYRKAVHCLQGSDNSPSLQEIRDPNLPKKGFSIIRRSPFLIGIAGLVLLMQTSVGLVEFQFNAEVENNISALDLRTQYIGRMLSCVNMGSGLLQLLGAGVMVHFLGLRGSHLAIPFMLLMSVMGLMVMPSFALVSFSFVFTKAIDFSLFGILREMLYIPLKTEEKFQAKAVIDVFVYRAAKALVSVGLLALSFFAGKELLSWVNSVMAAVLVLWILVVWFSFRHHLPRAIHS